MELFLYSMTQKEKYAKCTVFYKFNMIVKIVNKCCGLQWYYGTVLIKI